MSRSALARRVQAVEARKRVENDAWLDRLTDAELERLLGVITGLLPVGKDVADLSEDECAELHARWQNLNTDDLAFLNYIDGVRDGTVEPAG